MSDAPVLVVSDTHLGFQSESSVRFQHFLEYLSRWVSDDREGNPRKMAETLAAPRKIILLGDFIDLLISRDNNTIRPYQESFKIINALIGLGCEMVYVVGNHDAIMRIYADKRRLVDTQAFFGRVPVYPDLYPRPVDGRWKGERIGAKTYVFLHGHQFDPILGSGSMLRLGNFLGFTAATAEGFWLFTWLGLIVFIATLSIVLYTFFHNWVSWALSGLAASLTAWPWLAGWMPVIGLIVGSIAFLGILWFLGIAMKGYYTLFRHPVHPRYENNSASKPLWMRKFVALSTIGFTWKKRYIDADFVVYGHTHHPEQREFMVKDRILTRVNTGSWIKQDGDYDTFAYINEDGLRLFKWRDERRDVIELKQQPDRSCSP